MKLIATYKQHLFDKQGKAEVSFNVANFRHAALLDELDTTKQYAIEIKEVKSARSVEQNKMLWALLNELEKATQVEAMTWYAQALDETSAKYTYVFAVEEAERDLISAFRVVKRVKADEHNGTKGYVYKCYFGSSKFTVSEMTALIDVVMRFCYELDINIDERLM